MRSLVVLLLVPALAWALDNGLAHTFLTSQYIAHTICSLFLYDRIEP